MKNYKKIIAILSITAIAASACGQAATGTDSTSSSGGSNSTAAASNSQVSSTATATAISTEAAVNAAPTQGEYDDEDYVTEAASGAVQIQLSGTTATASGSGVEVEDGVVRITDAGTYVLQGKFQGRILVEAENTDVVHIIFNGVEITGTGGPALYASQSEKVILTLAEGSSNSLTDSSSYTDYDQSAEDAPNAALYVQDDLTINGTGSLSVTGNFEDGIRSKDDLRIISGTLEVSAAKDAIQGTDSVAIADGVIKLTAQDDSIVSTQDGDASKGYVIIDGGAIYISVAGDGISAVTSLTVNGGDIQIAKSTEGLEAANVVVNGGNIDIISSDDGINASETSSSIVINGGVINLNVEGDGLDSNGSLEITGGTVYMDGPTHQGNGAMDYDGSGSITGGTILALDAGGMSMGLGSGTPQGYILYNVGSSQAAGTLVQMKDSSGNVVVEYTSEKAFTTVLVSAEGMDGTDTYTLTVGGNSYDITLQNGIYSNGGGMKPGGRGGRSASQGNGIETDSSQYQGRQGQVPAAPPQVDGSSTDGSQYQGRQGQVPAAPPQVDGSSTDGSQYQGWQGQVPAAPPQVDGSSTDGSQYQGRQGQVPLAPPQGDGSSTDGSQYQGRQGQVPAAPPQGDGSGTDSSQILGQRPGRGMGQGRGAKSSQQSNI